MTIPDFVNFKGLSSIKVSFRTGTVVPVNVVFVIATVRAINSVSTYIRNKVSERTASSRLSNNIVYSNLNSSFTTLFKMLPGASFSRGMNLISVAGIIGEFTVSVKTVFLIVYNFYPGVKTLVSVVPRSILNKTTIVVFTSVLVSKVRLVAGRPVNDHRVAVVSMTVNLNCKLNTAANTASRLPCCMRLVFNNSNVIPYSLYTVLLGVVLPGGSGGTPCV